MGKIKGWTKVNNRQWQLEDQPSHIGLSIDRDIIGYYLVVDERIDIDKFKRHLSKPIDSEKEAKDMAIKWMKAHPRG